VIWVVSERADAKCYDLAASRLRLYQDPEMASELQKLMSDVWSATRGNQ